MRLNSIKLSGFKSFADAITLALPGQLVGVVGPNGCGKSNVMDAVRWVLGESRASELRGELMQDVIFSGAGERKPASRALVELVFDNSSQRAGGEFGRFAEIAVRRVLTRDGASSYYINGQRVRRRDVHDVFMGTGLGPRAYAIIGQGTISRIIESRPEELRLFLEEAAGVSKYRARRRETQNRLRDARANLTRLDDIQRELRGALTRLERQASMAQKYSSLQEQLTTAQIRLWQLRRAQAAQERDALQQKLADAEREQQTLAARVQQQQASLAALQQQHTAAGDAVSAAQAQLYEAAAEVGQLQAQIRYAHDGRERAKAQLAQLQQQWVHWQRQQREAEQDQDDAQRVLEDLQEQLAKEDEELVQSGKALAAARAQLEQAQQMAKKARDCAVAVAQKQQLVAADRRGLQAQYAQLQAQQKRLAAARAALPAPDPAALQVLAQRKDDAEQAATTALAQVRAQEDEVQLLQQKQAAAQQHASVAAAQAAQTRARLLALQELERQVQSPRELQAWCKRHGLTSAVPLWTQLIVEPGWERAVEAALHERLAAQPLSGAQDLPALFAEPPPARFSVYLHSEQPLALPFTAQRAAPPGLRWLTDVLAPKEPGLHAVLADWLAGCLAATTLDEALQARGQLQDGQTIFTREGHAVHAHGASFHADDSAQSGLMARAAEIAALRQNLQSEQRHSIQAQAELAALDDAVRQAAQQLAQARQQAAEQQRWAHDLQLEHARAAQQAQHAAQQRQHLASELSDVEQNQAALQQRLEELAQQTNTATAEQQSAQNEQAVCEQAEFAARKRLAAARQAHEKRQRSRQELDFERRSVQARMGELERSLTTAHTQQAQARVSIDRVQAELARLDAAPDTARLDAALVRKHRCEQTLAHARSDYETQASQLRTASEQHLALQQRQAPLAARTGELQLQEQAARLRVNEAEQRLAEAGAHPGDPEPGIHAEPQNATDLAQHIEDMQRQINALGPVNLAALSELATQRERQRELDEQSSDLGQAVQTLETAIRTIDAETRARLSQTFDAVNAHFGRMFPELFGGGRAELVMTGEQILDAGIEVMAQPPGKKNQTIRLLSGGEKALTAIALVFAIFQLNPAPFCLLDEVDAPLDDANTLRFTRLVQAMSAQGTQFVFISHNKLTMEMAEQLIGVTMQEQGVSRIVAVDIDDALQLAQAA